MSKSLNEPLTPPAVRTLVRSILAGGSVRFTRHALEEMHSDGLSELDVTNVLRGGAVEPGELENRSWRYRVRTQRIAVVIAFRSEASLVVVTAWRFTQ